MDKFARITLDKDFQISSIDKRIYGSFIEHLGARSTAAFTNPVTRPPTKTDFGRTSFPKCAR